MIKRILSVVLILISVIIAFIGCDRSADSSYAGILIVDGKVYIWHGVIENNEYTIGEKLGEVQRKVDAKVLPKSNFSSNLLETGEEIYTSKEDSNVIIVIRKNGSLDT